MSKLMDWLFGYKEDKSRQLAYTEKELNAIAALKRNAGTPKTLRELGIAPGTIISLRTKARKVDNGELITKGVDVCHIITTRTTKTIITSDGVPIVDSEGMPIEREFTFYEIDNR